MPKTIMIIAAMAEEMACLSHQFIPDNQEQYYHLDFNHSIFNNHKLITTIVGIGKVNAAVGTALACQRYQPDLVINIGVSGGLHEQMHVGDVVIAQTLKHHDAHATQFGYAPGQVPGMPAFYTSDESLMQSLLARRDQFPFTLFSGLVCSGDSFISDAALVIQLKTTFPEICALDMESSAVAQTCHQIKVPFLCIRGISDAGTEGAAQSYPEALALAMSNANQVLQAVL